MDNKIRKFLEIGDGYGNGYGYGYGNGDGYGYGDGDGDGYGNGNGNGDGDGYGYGNGYGNGYGYGNGDGYGYGDGDGDGYGYGNGYGNGDGYGYGIKRLNGYDVYKIDGLPTILTSVRFSPTGAIAKGYILKKNVYFKECFVVKGHGCFAHGLTIKEAQQALEDKIFENMNVEDKIREFMQKFEITKPYPASDFYDWHHKLTGSCEMGRKTFAANHDIDLENGFMTVEGFIAISRYAFGGEIIKQLAERYGLE